MKDHDTGHARDHSDGGRFWRRLLHGVVGHSHDAGERIDPALETSAQGIRTLKISLIGLGVTAALQLIVVFLSGSVALLGDTMHNFADALTSLPLWVAFNIGRRPPTRRYTYGYGKAEDIAGLFIVLAIGASAAFTAYEAIRRLITPEKLDNLPLVIAAGIIGFAGNELVAAYRIRTGHQIGSAALIADGKHSRTDGLTSLAVVVGGVGVALGIEVADPMAGLAITVALIFVLRGAARDVFRRLMDAVDPELVDHVKSVVTSVPGVRAVHDVRVRWMGHSLYAELRISIDAETTVRHAHEVAVDVEHRLLHDVPGLTAATVHVDPVAGAEEDPHEAIAHHRPRSRRSERPS